jgi:hypothetical protein
MDYHSIVKKLVGKIRPVGSTHIDNERFENLKELTNLVDKLLKDIDEVAGANENRPEYSMKRAGRFASDFFNKIGIVE